MLVDGGSQDTSPQLLAESGLPWCCGPRGRAAQMNYAAAQCKADILLFLHIDTVIDQYAIEALLQSMNNQSVVGGRFNLRLDASGLIFRVIETMINIRSRISRISTGDQAMFIRRSVFELMGGFPNLPLMEDIEMSHRLKLHGTTACLRQQVTTSARRWQQHGVMRTIMLMWKLRFLYWWGWPPEKLAEMYRNAR